MSISCHLDRLQDEGDDKVSSMYRNRDPAGDRRRVGRRTRGSRVEEAPDDSSRGECSATAD